MTWWYCCLVWVLVQTWQFVWKGSTVHTVVKINEVHRAQRRSSPLFTSSDCRLVVFVSVSRFCQGENHHDGAQFPFRLHLLSGRSADRHFTTRCLSRKTWCVFGAGLLWISHFSTTHTGARFFCVFVCCGCGWAEVDGKGPQSEGWGNSDTLSEDCQCLIGNESHSTPFRDHSVGWGQIEQVLRERGQKYRITLDKMFHF